jgi:hypothetical protein
MRKFAPIVATLSVLALGSSCTMFNTKVIDPLITELGKISAAGLADLTQLEAVASVPNKALPGGIEDADGLACAQAAVVVLTQVQAVNTAASGPGAGALTTAEIASLFQPGSVQYNQATNTLAAGCVAKANDVLGPAGVVAAGGVIGALSITNGILPIAAVAP